MPHEQKLWRLGMAEMVLPTSARFWARWLFLLAIQKHAPAVLADLRRRADDNGAVAAWARKWRLPDWVEPYATSTRRLWAEVPGLPDGWIDGDVFSGKGKLVADLTPHDAPDYDPRFETSAKYMDRVKAYVAARENAALQSGYVRRQRQDPRVFRWLVQRVVFDVSYAEIFRTDKTLTQSKSRNVVREACLKLASIIDLPIPPHTKRAQK